MATFNDLIPRLAALQAAGLVVASEYRGTPATWLTTALDDCDLRVVNCKGTKPDDVLVMVRLSKVEELLAVAAKQPDGDPVVVSSLNG